MFFGSLFLEFFKKCILDINPVSDVELAKIPSHFVACVFTWSIVSFIVPKHFSFIKPFFISFFYKMISPGIKELSPIPRSCRTLPMFSSSGFRFPVSTFKSIGVGFPAK